MEHEIPDERGIRMNAAQPMVYSCNACTEGDVCGLHPKNLLERIARKRLRLKFHGMDARILVIGRDTYLKILQLIAPPIVDVRDGVTYIMGLEVFVDFRSLDTLMVLGHPPTHGPSGVKDGAAHLESIQESYRNITNDGHIPSEIHVSPRVAAIIKGFDKIRFGDIPLTIMDIGEADFKILYTRGET